MENICLRKQMIWGNFTRLKMRWYYTGKITDWQKCLIVFKWVSANHCKNDLLIESPKWRIIILVSLTTNYFLLLPNYGKEKKCTKIKKQNWKRFLISIFFFSFTSITEKNYDVERIIFLVVIQTTNYHELRWFASGISSNLWFGTLSP